jgi:hypothetical protein
VSFLVIALANAVVFELVFGRRLDDLDARGETPASFKAIGFISLVAWLAVLYFGRMLPYLEPGLNSNL